MDTGLLDRCGGSMGENPPHQLGGMGSTVSSPLGSGAGSHKPLVGGACW